MEELYAKTYLVARWIKNPIFLGPLMKEQVLSAGHVAMSLGSNRTTTFGDRQMELIQRDGRIDTVVSSFTMVP